MSSTRPASNAAATLSGTLGDTAFNNAGGCRTTRLFPGSVANANNDQLKSNSIPLCGEMETWSVGVNWWMTEYMRLMFQYSASDLSNYPFFVPANPALQILSAVARCVSRPRKMSLLLRGTAGPCCDSNLPSPADCAHRLFGFGRFAGRSIQGEAPRQVQITSRA